MEWVPIILVIFKGSVLAIGMYYAIKWHHDQDKKAGDERVLPREMRVFVAMLGVMAMAVIGIVYAGCWGKAADGGFGGALGCAVALIFSLLPKPRVADDPAQLLLALASVEREKVYLGIAGAVSAIAWKYGDVAAGWLHFAS
jgi:hypothetical protein